MVTQSLSHIIYLVSTFFLKIFFLLIKKKKKNLFSSLVYCLHLLFYFLQHFPFIFAFFFHYYSLLYHYTSSFIFSFLYFDNSSPHFILFKFDIISFIQSIFFPHKNCEYSLSLSLSLSLLVNFCYFL